MPASRLNENVSAELLSALLNSVLDIEWTLATQGPSERLRHALNRIKHFRDPRCRAFEQWFACIQKLKLLPTDINTKISTLRESLNNATGDAPTATYTHTALGDNLLKAFIPNTPNTLSLRELKTLQAQTLSMLEAFGYTHEEALEATSALQNVIREKTTARVKTTAEYLGKRSQSRWGSFVIACRALFGVHKKPFVHLLDAPNDAHIEKIFTFLSERGLDTFKFKVDESSTNTFLAGLQSSSPTNIAHALFETLNGLNAEGEPYLLEGDLDTLADLVESLSEAHGEPCRIVNVRRLEIDQSNGLLEELPIGTDGATEENRWRDAQNTLLCHAQSCDEILKDQFKLDADTLGDSITPLLGQLSDAIANAEQGSEHHQQLLMMQLVLLRREGKLLQWRKKHEADKARASKHDLNQTAFGAEKQKVLRARFQRQKYFVIDQGRNDLVQTRMEMARRDRKGVRLLDKIAGRASSVAKWTIGTGEGVLPAVMAGSTASAFLFVGLPAFAVNVILFGTCIKNALKRIFTDPYTHKFSWRMRGLFNVDDKGYESSFFRRVLKRLSTFAALSSGIIMGILSFTFAKTGVVAALATIGIAFPPAGGVIVAAFIGTCTALGLFTLFLESLSNFIDEPKRPLNYFKNLVQPTEDWADLTGAEKATHVLKASLNVLLTLSFPFLLFVATAAPMALMKRSAQKLIGASRLARGTVWAITVLTTGVVTIFNIQNIKSMYATLTASITWAFGKCFKAMENTFLMKKVNNPAEAPRSAWTPGRIMAFISTAVFTPVLLLMAFANAASRGVGTAKDGGIAGIKLGETACGMTPNPSLEVTAAECGGFAGSFTATQKAVVDTFATDAKARASVSTEDLVDMADSLCRNPAMEATRGLEMTVIDDATSLNWMSAALPTDIFDDSSDSSSETDDDDDTLDRRLGAADYAQSQVSDDTKAHGHTDTTPSSSLPNARFFTEQWRRNRSIEHLKGQVERADNRNISLRPGNGDSQA